MSLHAFEPLESRLMFSTQFVQTNLVSDGAVPAQHIDPNLINPWGVSFSPTSSFWISDNGASVATLYNSAGVPQSLIVNIPGGGGQPSAPTGQAFNNTGQFVVSENGKSAPAVFLFVGEDGGISGWNPTVDPHNAILMVDRSQEHAVFKGMTLGTMDGQPVLYATNFHSGKIEAYDGSLNRIHLREDAFHDIQIPERFAPFNVRAMNGLIYVTYAKQDHDKHDDVAGAGNGYVDAFTMDGKLVMRLQHGDFLNSPWGLEIAPSSFGDLAGDILVGQFGSGLIDAFNPNSGQFISFLDDSAGHPIQNDGLWTITVGNGSNSNSLFFTAGLNHEADGLFGRIDVIT